MPKFTAGGKQLEADLLVFDKDGLMFDSEQFWIELVNERCGKLLRYLNPEEIVRWARLMGADTVLGEGGEAITTYVDPLGICACAAPREEISITAAFLVSVKGWPWHQARAAAEEVFEQSSQTLDLKKALRPQPGFGALMQRLREFDVPYGVATSDTLERTRASMELYDAWDQVRFVITPETFTYDIDIDHPETNHSYQTYRAFLSAHPGTDLLLGALTYRTFTGNKKPTRSARSRGAGFWFDVYNTAMVMDSAQIYGHYVKSKLVPGVEIIPYENLLPFLGPLIQKFGGSSSSYGTQDEMEAIPCSDGRKVGAMIYYESVYGDWSRMATKKGADFLAVMTNDG
ncbi:MAG: hypothetical protein IKH74_06535 [Lachnospiraceae bacterium]|nr:hypothetical protein [Lachnospiraceae bacterium]